MGSIPQLSVVKGAQRDLHRRPIHRLFEQSLTEHRHFAATALIDLTAADGAAAAAGQRLDYGRLNARANRLARLFAQQMGASAASNADGDWIVAVCMPPSAELVAVLLAVWKAGAAYLPIDAAFPADRIRHIVGEARPALVVYDEPYAGATASRLFTGASTTTAVLTAGELAAGADAHTAGDLRDDEMVASAAAGSERLALVLYTSGSTGVPKGVRLPHAIVQNRLQWQFDAFPYAADERTAVFKTALTFVDSVAEIWGPLLQRRALLIVPKAVTKDPERLVGVLEEYGVQRLVLVPTLLRSLLMYLPMAATKGGDSAAGAGRPLRSLRIWVCSGEALSVQLAREFFDYFGGDGGGGAKPVLCNFYGSTEIMGDVTYFVCESGRQLAALEKVPIGYPISNTVVYVLDADMRPVRQGETGELWVAGANLASGYVGGRDKFRFVENPLAVDPKYDRLYRTGDFASVRKGGALQYEGRTDSQIKIRGHRVDLSEVERHLFALEQLVDKGLVLCYRPGEIDQALLAFVTVHTDAAAPQQRPTGRQVEKALAGRLADYMLPQVIVVDTIPLLVNGKVDRQTLLKTYENANNNDDPEIPLDFDYTGVPADQMPAARDLFETIGASIGRSARTAISLAANFYQLGGNSLNSIYTVAQLRQKGHHIGISEFIKARTLRDVLQRICVAAAGADANDAAAAESSDDDGADEDRLRMHITALQLNDKAEVIELMTRSFFEKADLERWMKPNILYTDYGEIFEAMYEHFVANGLCFVVWDQTERMVGVALNTDANDEPEIEIHSKLATVFEFLEEIEGPIREHQLPGGKGQIFHTLMMGTSAQLNAQQNIAVMQRMETEVLVLARRLRFGGILTTNTSPLTQQLGTHVYGYETLLNYQVNEYTSAADGTRPFGQAPDSQRALVQWKRIGAEAATATAADGGDNGAAEQQ